MEDLRQISLGISLNRPVLVSGPIGSGKTHLIRYTAQNTQQSLICYQLSEETDAQSLLGGYVQAEDGSFRWRPGPLAKAASEGDWILLEDVHQAAGDCVPLIGQLVERNVLNIAGHGQPIIPHPNFQLFLTERTGSSGNKSTGTTGSKLYTKCHLVKLESDNSIERMESVINAHYPKMKQLIQKIPIQVVQSLLTYSGNRAGSESGRKIGLREAIKFANRLSRHEPKMDNEKRIAFSIQDAIDIFAEYAHSTDEKKRLV